MAEVALTDAAIADLLEAADLLGSHSRSAGHASVDGFERQLGILRMFPQAGRVRPDLGADVRILPFANWLMAYRLTRSGDVEILRVIHGARDYVSLFQQQGQ